mmetsp:Transcript_12378/g.15446  ORF Transcript_12378/g.15446 Transcript_12378/m.15446 type:complete len:114 (+) Transcript_12378:2480-2821(+)
MELAAAAVKEAAVAAGEEPGRPDDGGDELVRLADSIEDEDDNDSEDGGGSKGDGDDDDARATADERTAAAADEDPFENDFFELELWERGIEDDGNMPADDDDEPMVLPCVEWG